MPASPAGGGAAPGLASERDTCHPLGLRLPLSESPSPPPPTPAAAIAPDVTSDKVGLAASSQRTRQEVRLPEWTRQLMSRVVPLGRHRVPRIRAGTGPQCPRSCPLHFRTRDSRDLRGCPLQGPCRPDTFGGLSGAWTTWGPGTVQTTPGHGPHTILGRAWERGAQRRQAPGAAKQGPPAAGRRAGLPAPRRRPAAWLPGEGGPAQGTPAADSPQTDPWW